MEYKKCDCNSYQIHTVKTDKFKTVRMEIIFSREVEKEKMPIFTFLADILSDCSKKYQRRKDMAIRLEELYKSIFYGVTNKVGNLFTISFVLEFIAPEYINDPKYLENILKFPFEVLNNPRVKNQEFDLTNFNIVKKSVLEEVESLKESVDKLALTTALEKMDINSPSAYRVMGTKEDIEKITPSSLYEAYLDLFKSNCDIFLIGNLNMDEATKIIKENFKNRIIKLNKPSLVVGNKLRSKPIKIEEPANFIQSTLVMIYNVHDLPKKLRNIDFHVFNYIFGNGGLTSRLYQKLRMENSLCYAVRSLYLKYDELLVIEVSLDENNVKLAQKLIQKAINEMVKGKFNDTEFEDARRNLGMSLKLGLDNNVAILNNYEFNYYDDIPLIEERIKLVKEVKKEDLIKCAKSLKLNTVFVQVPNSKGAK